jgi:16S rRNA (cytosine967-C5)-methyltransferase
MSRPAQPLVSARQVVVRAITRAAEQFPDIDPQSLSTERLPPRDAALALAIHRTVLQRWLTLDHLLGCWLQRPLSRFEPALQAVLLCGAAQLLFMDRIPPHAVVDESVKLASAMVRRGAAGLTNAVLRRLSEQVDRSAPREPWAPSPDRIPRDGGCVRLRSPLLPPLKPWETYWSTITSHPRALVRNWQKQYGAEVTEGLCLHGIETPPIIVAVEHGFSWIHKGAESPYEPHTLPGFVVWQGTHDAMVDFLAGHPARRVQDPASALPVQAGSMLSPQLVLDYCAGRGTKTRQLAAQYPNARIIATDADPLHYAELGRAFHDHPTVTVCEPSQLGRLLAGNGCDLLVLDVPCSNTGVLARRPEARYRFNTKTLASLADLQRRIVQQSVPLLRPGGHVLYSTCSLQEQENRAQVRWLCGKHGLAVRQEALTLPAGRGGSYHDGGYYALMKSPGTPGRERFPV